MTMNTPEGRTAATAAADGAYTPRFQTTVDVLELVCEAVGFGDAATLCALRAASWSCADAVRGSVRRMCGQEDAAHPWASTEMAPPVARVPAAARLCVVAGGGAWLRAIPASVVRSTNPRKLLANVKRVLAHVPAPRSMSLECCGSAVTRAVVDAIVGAAAGTLESLTVTRSTGLTAAAVGRIAGLGCLTTLALSHNTYSQVTDETVIPLVRALAATLTHVDLSGNGGGITDETLAAISAALPDLRVLRLSRPGGKVSDAGLAHVAAGCPALEELDVLFGKDRVTDCGVTAVAEHCPKLRALNVSWCDVTDASILAVADTIKKAAAAANTTTDGTTTLSSLIPPAPTPFAIEVSDTNGGVTGESLVALAEAAGGLRALNITGTMGAVTDGHMARIALASAATLTTLKAANDTRLSDAGIVAVAASCASLTSLDIGWSSGRITDEAIVAVARGCRGLRELCVSHTSGLASDRSIMAVAEHCKQLEALSSSASYGDVTDKGLAAIARGCPRLVALDVSHTQGKVSDETVRALAAHCPRFATLGCSGVRRHWSASALSDLSTRCPAFASAERAAIYA